MERIKRFLGRLLNLKSSHRERSASRRAKIFEEGNPVCTKDNRDNCYEPNSIRLAFKPLGVIAKLFGLFPRYDLSFVDNLEDKGIKCIHILDYVYSLIIFSIICGGAIIVAIRPPNMINRMQIQKEKDLTDFYVNMIVVYVTLAMGVMSLFVFPLAGRKLLRFLDHFSHLDLILRFDGRMEERWFAIKVLFYEIAIFLGSLVAYVGLYILEVKEEEHLCYTDYIMPPILAVSGAALLIPSGLVVFFLNAIRLRLYHFNQVLKSLVLPETPSCLTCYSYGDYGKELEKAEQTSLDLEKDLEKMRILYAEIVSLTTEMGCIFGTHLARDVLYSILGLILYTYFLMYMSQDTISSSFVYVILDSFLVMKLFTLSTFAQRIVCYSIKSKEMLQKVCFQRISPGCRLQVQLFINLLDCPMGINCAGYFTIDRRLITSILGAITTYFIILVQFKVGEVKQELNTLATICTNLSAHNVATTFLKRL